jgi:hypothetical protein
MYGQREDIRPTLGRWANVLAVAAAGFLPAAFALVAFALSIGGPSESKNAWILGLGEFAAYSGVTMVVAAFLLASGSRIRREPIDSLAFPFALLPVVAAVVLLIGFFWVR